MTEAKFVHALEILEGQIAEASQFWFAGATINEVSKRPETNAAIQLTAGFWICTRLALEQQAILAVGKIFGQRSSNPNNIDRFVEVLRESRLTVFSKDALAARKSRDIAPTDEQLADLMKTARTLTESDIRRLHTLSKRHRKTYETQFAAIRSRHIAHTEVVDPSARHEMFQKTHIPDLEKLFMFLNQLLAAMRALYYDGHRPVMRRMRWSVRSLVAEDIHQLNQTPNHEFIVSETRKCMFLITEAAKALPRGYKRRGSWDD